MRIELVGVYEIGEPPWVLVELMLADVEAPLDISAFVLADPALPKENWQAAYDELLLDPAGTNLVANSLELMRRPELLIGNIRLSFFLYIDGSRTLLTPSGPVELPKASSKPRRLAFLEFEEP